MDALPGPFILHHYPVLGVLESYSLSNEHPVSDPDSQPVASPTRISPTTLEPHWSSYTTTVKRRVLQHFGKYPLEANWDATNAKEALSGFAVVPVHEGDYISSKIRYLPSQSINSLENAIQEARRSHSQFSPLNRHSPLFPEGLISPQWMTCHHQRYPSVLVSFHDLKFHHNISANVPQASTMGDQTHPLASQSVDSFTLADERLASDLLYGQRIAKMRGLRYIPLLIVDEEEHTQSSTDERIHRIRKRASVDGKLALTVLRPMNSEQFDQTMVGLTQGLLDYSMTHYRELAKRAKRRSQHLMVADLPSPGPVQDKPSMADNGASGDSTGPMVTAATSFADLTFATFGQRTETKYIDPHGLPMEGWLVRYQYKQGVFAEFRQDIVTALKHYCEAYTHILDYAERVAQRGYPQLDRLLLFTPRWEELRAFMDSLCWKIRKLYFYTNSHASSAENFNGYINSFSSILHNAGYGEEASYYWNWLTNQHQTFAALLELGIKHRLQLPLSTLPNARLSGSGRDMTSGQAGGLVIDRSVIASYTIPDVGTNPATLVQHPGHYYHAAALCNAQFRNTLSKELAGNEATTGMEGSAEEDPVRRNYDRYYSVPLRDRPVDQSYQTSIGLLTHAYELFRQYRNVRYTLYMASEIAETYFEWGKYDTATKFFERIAKTYRREQWATILSSTLRWSLHCAVETDAWASVAKLLLELLAPNLPVSSQERDEYLTKLLKILDLKEFSTADGNPTETSADPSLSPQGQATATGDGFPVTLDMTTVHPCITCHIQFASVMTHYTLDPRPMKYQIALIVPPGVLSVPLVPVAIRVEFSDTRYNYTINHSAMSNESAQASDQETPRMVQQSMQQHPLVANNNLAVNQNASSDHSWRVQWQNCDPTRTKESNHTYTDLSLTDGSCKVLQCTLWPQSPATITVTRVLVDIGPTSRRLTLLFPFEDVGAPTTGFVPGEALYSHKITWWPVVANHPFGFARFDRPRWLTCSQLSFPEDEQSSRLRWKALPYTGFTHRLTVQPALSRLTAACNLNHQPVYVDECFPVVITLTNQEICPIRARLKVELDDPLGQLSQTPWATQSPPTTSPCRQLAMVEIADGKPIPAGETSTVTFYVGGFQAAGVAQVKCHFQYQPTLSSGASDDDGNPEETTWSDLVRTVSNEVVYEFPVLQPFLAVYRCSPLSMSSVKVSADMPTFTPDDTNDTGHDPLMATTGDGDSRSTSSAPSAYWVIGQLRNIAHQGVNISDWQLVPVATDSSTTSVPWSSYRFPSNSSPESNSTLASRQYWTHAFQLLTTLQLGNVTSADNQGPVVYTRVVWRRSLSPSSQTAANIPESGWNTTLIPVYPQDLNSHTIMVLTDCAPVTSYGTSFDVTFYATNTSSTSEDVDVSIQESENGAHVVANQLTPRRLVLGAGETWQWTVACATPRCGLLSLPVLVVHP
ncbi:hypothetical protein IWQ61_007755, partial [Dispira simplex]